jgi:hypothetical protein
MTTVPTRRECCGRRYGSRIKLVFEGGISRTLASYS